MGLESFQSHLFKELPDSFLLPALAARTDHSSVGAHDGLKSLHRFTELQDFSVIQPFSHALIAAALVITTGWGFAIASM